MSYACYCIVLVIIIFIIAVCLFEFKILKQTHTTVIIIYQNVIHFYFTQIYYLITHLRLTTGGLFFFINYYSNIFISKNVFSLINFIYTFFSYCSLLTTMRVLFSSA